MKQIVLSSLALALSLTPLLSQAKSCNAGQLDLGYGTKVVAGLAQAGPTLVTGGGIELNNSEGFALDSLDNSYSVMTAAGNGATTLLGVSRLTSDGLLDQGFGGFGYVIPPNQSSIGSTHMAVDSLDRALLVQAGGDGLLRVWRYLPSGKPDPAFGSSGYASLAIDNLFTGPVGVTAQGDGKVVVATAAVDPTINKRKGLVVRFNADGSVDSGFGNGGISAITPVGYGGNQRVGGVVVLGDGRIAVSGNQASDVNRVLVARLLANGAPDPSFGTGGSSVFQFPSDTFGRKLALQGDGKLVIAGSTFDVDGAFETSVVRVNTDGSLDMGFGSSGQAIYRGPYGQLANNLALQSNGKILVAGQTLLDPDFNTSAATITRFNSNGALDTGFGSGGVAMASPAGSFGNTAAVRETSDGMIASMLDAYDPSADSVVRYGFRLQEGSGNGCN